MGRIRIGDGIPEQLGLYGLPSGEFVYRVNYARQHPYDWRFARSRLLLGLLLCLGTLPVGGWHTWWPLAAMTGTVAFALVELVTEMGDWSARWRRFLRMAGLRWWWTARDLQLQHNVLLNAGGIVAMLYIVILFPTCMIWGILPLLGTGSSVAADWRVLGVWLGVTLYQISLARSFLYDTGFLQPSRSRMSERFRIWVRWLAGPALTGWLLVQLAVGLPGEARLFTGMTPAFLLVAGLPLLLIGEVSLFSRRVIAEDREYRRAQEEQRSELVRRALDISEPVLAAAIREQGETDRGVGGLDVLPFLLGTLAYDQISPSDLSAEAVAEAVRALAAGYGVDAHADVTCSDVTMPELRTMLRVVGTVLAVGCARQIAHETAQANAASMLTVSIDGQGERSRQLQITVHCTDSRVRLEPGLDAEALQAKLLAMYPVVGHRPMISVERHGDGAAGSRVLGVCVSFGQQARQ